MYTLNKNSTNKKKKMRLSPWLLLAGLFVIAAVLFTLEKTGITNFYQSNKQEPSSPIQEPMINYGPPTESEVRSGDEKKQEIINQEQTTPTEPITKVNVVIVDASQYGEEVEVRAFASNIIKDGTCIFTFSKDGQTFKKTSPANDDATTSPCVTVTVPRSEFPSSGKWSLLVEYNTEGASGSSETTLDIQ